MTVDQAIDQLEEAQPVIYAQANHKFRAISTLPNDPAFAELWGLHNIGQTGGTQDADIDAAEAWDISTGSATVIVGVIDTGIDYTHPDLAANMWINNDEFHGTPGVDDDGNGYIDDIYGYDVANGDGDPRDDHYHGTHCAGTIGGVGNNAAGVAGVCWNAKLMAIKFLDSAGYGNTADAIECVQYGVDMGARVLSNSWGGGSFNQGLKDAIAAAGAAGVLFVAAAGNSGQDTDIVPHYPSSYDVNNIIAVMATDMFDHRSIWPSGNSSNYGFVSVDIAAPGSDVLSCAPGGSYQYLGGTSMACPHVSGACALLLSKNPGLSCQAVKTILMDTADKILPGMCASEGRLNVHSALLESGSSWLEFYPASGTVRPGDSNEITLLFTGNGAPGSYQGHITVATNDPYKPEITIPVVMTIETADTFTENFEAGGNDMAFKTLTFTPDGSTIYYKACVNDATALPVDPAGGTALNLGDDDYEQIVFANGQRMPFYGINHDRLYVGSNGYITFVSGDTHYMQDLENHFSLPRISALYEDLNPAAGGTISWKQLEDRIVITFEGVCGFNSPLPNTFQVDIHFGGKIRITYLQLGTDMGLIGLSSGMGLSAYFAESDLSEYGVCTFTGDLNCDCDVDIADFAVLATYWNIRHDPGSVDNVLDAFDLVSYGNNDGTNDWTGEWQEIGESDGPGSGAVRVTIGAEPNGLQIGPDARRQGATREVDLAGGDFATLSFDWKRSPSYKGRNVTVGISSDGGASWTTLLAIADEGDTAWHHEAFDVSGLAGSQMQVSFYGQSVSSGYLCVDNVQVEYGRNAGTEPWLNECDFNHDLIIDCSDMCTFAEHWLD